MKKASNITSNNRYRRSIIDDNLSQFKKRVGNINYINKPIDKDQPLLLAIQYEADKIFSYLISSINIDLSIVDKDGQGALHYAIDVNRIDYVRILIDRGIDVNNAMHYFDKNDPLSLAIRNNNKDIVLLLIYTGANITDRHLMFTIEHCNSYIFNFMIKHYLLTHRISRALYNDLFVNIIKHKCFQSIDVLFDTINDDEKLKRIINRRHKCFFRRTILHMLVLFNNIRYVKKLLIHGASVNIKDKSGNTPLHLVKDIEIAKLLIDYGADKHAMNDKNKRVVSVLAKNDSELSRFVLNYRNDRFDDLSTLHEE
jgi:ankyrin repeat protein